jgi:hypothetical protein
VKKTFCAWVLFSIVLKSYTFFAIVVSLVSTNLRDVRMCCATVCTHSNAQHPDQMTSQETMQGESSSFIVRREPLCLG